MLLEKDHTVLITQAMTGEGRGAWIIPDSAAANKIQPWAKRFRCLPHIQKARHALIGFTSLARLAAGQVVIACSRVRFDIQPRVIGTRGYFQYGKEDGMLEHIRPVSGVKPMLIGKQDCAP